MDPIHTHSLADLLLNPSFHSNQLKNNHKTEVILSHLILVVVLVVRVAERVAVLAAQEKIELISTFKAVKPVPHYPLRPIEPNVHRYVRSYSSDYDPGGSGLSQDHTPQHVRPVAVCKAAYVRCSAPALPSCQLDEDLVPHQPHESNVQGRLPSQGHCHVLQGGQ